MKLANQIKKLRIHNNLTQKELADNLGMPRSRISMYELGQREPDFETIEKIADYFNVDVIELLGYNNEFNSMERYIIDMLRSIKSKDNKDYESIIRLIETYAKK